MMLHIYRLWKKTLPCGVAFVIVAAARIASAAGETQATRIPNPIAAASFPCLVQTVSRAAIQVAIPLAIITIIFAGLRFIFAGLQGNQTKIADARKMLLWAVVGTAIVVGSFAIANAAVQIFGGQGATASCK